MTPTMDTRKKSLMSTTNLHYHHRNHHVGCDSDDKSLTTKRRRRIRTINILSLSSVQMTVITVIIITLLLSSPKVMVHGANTTTTTTTTTTITNTASTTTTSTTTRNTANTVTTNSTNPYDKIDTRIVGGLPVRVPDRYPYYGIPAGPSLCGATLLWNDIVITAGHCVEAFKQGGILIGGTTVDGRASRYYPIVQSLVYPQYNPLTYDDDIAILQIGGNAPGPYAQINANGTIPAVGQTVTVIGYGHTSENGIYSLELLQVDLTTNTPDVCSELYSTHFYHEEHSVCIGGNTKTDIGQDSCQGDSGGPLLLSNTNVIVGLVSFGDGCARLGIPSVNTRISYYHDWIEQQICSVSAYPPASCNSTSSNNETYGNLLQPEEFKSSTKTVSGNDPFPSSSSSSSITTSTTTTTSTATDNSDDSCIPIHHACTDTSSCCIDSDSSLEYNIQCMIPSRGNQQLRSSIKKCIMVPIV